jgi:hypothetical protein
MPQGTESLGLEHLAQRPDRRLERTHVLVATGGVVAPAVDVDHHRDVAAVGQRLEGVEHGVGLAPVPEPTLIVQLEEGHPHARAVALELAHGRLRPIGMMVEVVEAAAGQDGDPRCPRRPPPG